MAVDKIFTGTATPASTTPKKLCEVTKPPATIVKVIPFQGSPGQARQPSGLSSQASRPSGKSGQISQPPGKSGQITQPPGKSGKNDTDKGKSARNVNTSETFILTKLE